MTVEAQASQVDTSSAAVSTLVEPTQMNDLPLNGRDFEQLLTLAPGAQTIRASVEMPGLRLTLIKCSTSFRRSSDPGSRLGSPYLLERCRQVAIWTAFAPIPRGIIERKPLLECASMKSVLKSGNGYE